MSFFSKRVHMLCALMFSMSVSAGPLPDEHAPIGVMGDHTHKEGEWMFSYRYMTMNMDGNRDDTDRLATSEVLRSGSGIYAVAPLEMTMEMHMLGAMYAPSDRYTLMVMVPWLKNEMDHATAMGGAFTTESSDLGDISVAALIPYRESSSWLVGVSIPTGDLDQRDQTPMGRSVLPYPMQIGTGTYNLQLGYTLMQYRDGYSWGGQIKGNFPIGENDQDYSVGNRYEASVWLAKRMGTFSWSARTHYQRITDYDGADPRYAMGLASNLIPTVDPDLRDGQRLDVALGVNWAHRSGVRLALEYSVPAYQKLDGPQLEVDNVFTFGFQYSPAKGH